MHRKSGLVLFVAAMFVHSGFAGAAAPGFLEGHINIGPLRPVERVDQPPATPSAQTYAAYRVVVLKVDGKIQVTQLAPNEHGNYRLALPPAKYVLDIRNFFRGGTKGPPRTVTVISGQTTRADIDIDTGIR